MSQKRLASPNQSNNNTQRINRAAKLLGEIANNTDRLREIPDNILEKLSEAIRTEIDGRIDSKKEELLKRQVQLFNVIYSLLIPSFASSIQELDITVAIFSDGNRLKYSRAKMRDGRAEGWSEDGDMSQHHLVYETDEFDNPIGKKFIQKSILFSKGDQKASYGGDYLGWINDTIAKLKYASINPDFARPADNIAPRVTTNNK